MLASNSSRSTSQSSKSSAAGRSLRDDKGGGFVWIEEEGCRDDAGARREETEDDTERWPGMERLLMVFTGPQTDADVLPPGPDDGLASFKNSEAEADVDSDAPDQSASSKSCVGEKA